MNCSSLTPVSTSRGSNEPSALSANTTLRVPVISTADSGTTMTSRAGSWMTTSANISGLSAPSRLSTSMRTFAVRVVGSMVGAMNAIVPVKVRPGR